MQQASMNKFAPSALKQAFWDYNFSERQLLQKLEKGTKEEKIWIIRRILENLPFKSIWRYTTPAQVKDLFPYLHLRPKFKQIWSYTLSLWGKYEKTSH
ncbi:hypothetical protein HYS92_02275 [Candidatus Daviesbacteria bacterium]|nr:hypothetical protein [Candidatus Daviesbacteria bacterium]